MDPKRLTQADKLAPETMYKEVSRCRIAPATMITPDGVFTIGRDGFLKVYDFDAKGNWYELSPQEQSLRIRLTKARFAI